MIININDDTRIETDKYQWICSKRHYNKAKQTHYFKHTSFHPTLALAAQWVFNREIMESDAESLSGILKAVEGARNLVLAAIPDLSLNRRAS